MKRGITEHEWVVSALTVDSVTDRRIKLLARRVRPWCCGCCYRRRQRWVQISNYVFDKPSNTFVVLTVTPKGTAVVNYYTVEHPALIEQLSLV